VSTSERGSILVSAPAEYAACALGRRHERSGDFRRSGPIEGEIASEAVDQQGRDGQVAGSSR
jgi:hypothetical protein